MEEDVDSSSRAVHAFRIGFRGRYSPKNDDGDARTAHPVSTSEGDTVQAQAPIQTILSVDVDHLKRSFPIFEHTDTDTANKEATPAVILQHWRTAALSWPFTVLLYMFKFALGYSQTQRCILPAPAMTCILASWLWKTQRSIIVQIQANRQGLIARLRHLFLHYRQDSFPVLADSGASCHYTPYRGDFLHYRDVEPGEFPDVITAAGSQSVTGVGSVCYQFKDDNGESHDFYLDSVRLLKSVPTRLLSPQTWAQSRRQHDPFARTTIGADTMKLRWSYQGRIFTRTIPYSATNVGLLYQQPRCKLLKDCNLSPSDSMNLFGAGASLLSHMLAPARAQQLQIQFNPSSTASLPASTPSSPVSLPAPTTASDHEGEYQVPPPASSTVGGATQAEGVAEGVSKVPSPEGATEAEGVSKVPPPASSTEGGTAADKVPPPASSTVGNAAEAEGEFKAHTEYESTVGGVAEAKGEYKTQAEYDNKVFQFASAVEADRECTVNAVHEYKASTLASSSEGDVVRVKSIEPVTDPLPTVTDHERDNTTGTHSTNRPFREGTAGASDQPSEGAATQSEAAAHSEGGTLLREKDCNLSPSDSMNLDDSDGDFNNRQPPSQGAQGIGNQARTTFDRQNDQRSPLAMEQEGNSGSSGPLGDDPSSQDGSENDPVSQETAHFVRTRFGRRDDRGMDSNSSLSSTKGSATNSSSSTHDDDKQAVQNSFNRQHQLPQDPLLQGQLPQDHVFNFQQPEPVSQASTFSDFRPSNLDGSLGVSHLHLRCLDHAASSVTSIVHHGTAHTAADFLTKHLPQDQFKLLRAHRAPWMVIPSCEGVLEYELHRLNGQNRYQLHVFNHIHVAVRTRQHQRTHAAIRRLVSRNNHL